MSEGAMSPVIQDTDELSPNSSILFDSDSSSSASLELAQSHAVASTEENGSVKSMEFHEERFSASDTEADSAISLVKCLNSASPSSSLVCRRNDNSAIIRLNNELLKAKRSNWEVVDALGKAYQDIKDLRLREQRLNSVLSNCSSKLGSTNGFSESLALPEGKIIELQLALRREEAVKMREDLRALIDERDKLKEKLGMSESDRRLVSFTSDQRERELELSQSHIKDLAANIKEKDARILSIQKKLIAFENEMKVKDEELDKIRDEKNALREAVIRSEQEIEALSEKLQNVLLSKDESAKHHDLSRNAGPSLGIETQESAQEVLKLNGEEIVEEETGIQKQVRYLETRHSEDTKIIQELSSQLKEWESIVKAMNDYVQDTNQQQLEARNEIANYIKILERQLRETKKNRHMQMYVAENDGSVQGTTQATQQHEPVKGDLRDEYQQASQVKELNQSGSVNFEDYLKGSSEFDELENELNDNLNSNEVFPKELENAVEPENVSLDCCFQSSAMLVVQPDEVRMARVACVEEFESKLHEFKRTSLRDSKTRPERPARKKDTDKRRKLPQVTRKTSLDSERSTYSAASHSDETLSVTSFESQVSRDKTDMRSMSRGGSGRRLPPVPSGEELDLDKADVTTDKPASQLPGVTSLYHKGPSDTGNKRHDSGLGESVKNSPALPGHKFSISKRLRRRFSKDKAGSGPQPVVGESPRSSRKGLFHGKLCLGKTKRRRNSIGTSSSVSDSFKTVTPLNSDEEDAAGFADESFDGGSVSSAIRTSTPKKGSRLMNKGDAPSPQSRRIAAQRKRAALLLIFRYLNPIELCGLARVCREWRAMSEHPTLWKHVTLEETPLNNMALQVISRRCSCMQSLRLKGLKKIKSSEKSHSSTSSEDMCCYLERGLEFLLKAAGSSLMSLHIEDCGIFISDRCLALAGCHCRELQQLVYISDSFPACPEAVWALWACRKLVSIRIPPMFPCDHPGRFNDKSLEMIANCWPNMRHLSVGGPSLSSAGLIHIAKGCLRLQELELDRTIAINEEMAHAMCLCGLRGLETISFTFTPVSPGAIKELLGACPRLERIEVHIGISDYFMDADDDVSKRKYTRIVKKLTALKQENQEFARVLWIKADYG